MEGRNLDGDLEERFRKFVDSSRSFAAEITSLVSPEEAIGPKETAKINLFLAKTLFSKWTIEILAILYGDKMASFGEMKKGVKGITSRVLSQKLKNLEEAGLVKRSIINSRPPGVRYTLTEKGLTVAKLAEPVFLYAAITEGLYSRPQILIQQGKW